MSPKGRISKKDSSKKNEKSHIVPLDKFYEIPFLDRPLPTIMSILRYMQFSRETKTDMEVGMYYTPKTQYPYDPLSKKQMEVFGYTFSNESNADALLKINPIPAISLPVTNKNKNYHQNVEPPQQSYIEPIKYSSPIGPLPFLHSTVPQSPNPTFVDFLKACSK